MCGLPIVVTVVLSVAASLDSGMPLIDWLMPAELFPPALVGGLLLIWAASRVHRRLWPIAGTLAFMVMMLVGGQVLAVVSGLADGSLQPGGWQWAAVVASIVLYTAALLVLTVLGCLLARDVWRAIRSR